MDATRRGVLAGATAGLLPLGAAAETTGWTMPAERAIEVREAIRIPMADGVTLCGRLWLPKDAAPRATPVVLEYIPYRTRDAYSAADDHWGKVLASHGIAFARIDIRGSGDSEGLLHDEYLSREQDDAVAIIAWLAAQPWCNGHVGMRGISWGGFSTLQTAMRRPPALKAIMPIACSDRRYTDDAHYVGGCLGLTNFKWAANFKAVMAAPPDPAIAGAAWERMWRDRLEASPPIAAWWTEHRDEDAYWRHGSLHFDYAAITCPTYIVAGSADAYVHSVPRMLARLSCPRKALVGPWGHTYPWLGGEGHALEWAREEIRWWSHWLLGQETGIMREPAFRVFMAEALPGEAKDGVIPGRWASEPAWPAPHVRMRDYHCTDADLSPATGTLKPRRHRSRNIVGLATPEWVPFGQQEQPGDQREDDARSITFDTAPLDADAELLGTPVARLRVSADRPAAQLAVRLCKVRPDGSSWRLGYGLLDLRHRNGHDRRVPLEPGKPFDVAIELGFVAQRLKAGERLRVSISEGLWPLVWPSPDSPTLTLERGALSLPFRAAPATEPPLPMAEYPLPGDPGEVAVKTARDGDRVTITGTWPDKERTCANGTILSGFGPNSVAEIVAGDPSSARWTGEKISRYRRGDWDCRLHITFAVTAAPGGVTVEERIEAFRGETRVFERSGTAVLPA